MVAWDPAELVQHPPQGSEWCRTYSLGRPVLEVVRKHDVEVGRNDDVEVGRNHDIEVVRKSVLAVNKADLVVHRCSVADRIVECDLRTLPDHSHHPDLDSRIAAAGYDNAVAVHILDMVVGMVGMALELPCTEQDLVQAYKEKELAAPCKLEPIFRKLKAASLRSSWAAPCK